MRFDSAVVPQRSVFTNERVNMSTILYGLLVGGICAIPFDRRLFSKESGGLRVVWLVQTIVFGLIAGLWYYFGALSLAGPFWGTTGVASVLFGLNLVVTLVTLMGADGYRDERPGVLRYLVPVIVLLVFAGRGILGTGLFTASEKFRMIGAVQTVAASESVEFLEPIAHSHIRMVSLEQASWMMDKVLGEAENKALGSRFTVGHPSIQRVGGELVFVAPLEYRAFRHWTSSRGTPGYVVVSAEDAASPARLVLKPEGSATEFEFRYMPSAFFGDNLVRYVYESGHRGLRVADYHFELDEERTPHWVVTLTEPTIHYTASAVRAVLVVDPQSGNITRYAPDEVPSWVDRVIPEQMAVDYLSWWGSYARGFWNAFWTKDGVTEPTAAQLPGTDAGAERVWLAYGRDGEAYWFTGMTSESDEDQSLVSFVLMSSRTGATREFRLSGANEAGVMQAVDSAVSNYTGFHATAPILYHLYGEYAWVVPVVSETHIFQRLAIVRASNGEVVLGNTKQEALRAYQRLLTSSGNQANPEVQASVSRRLGTIDRIYGDVQNGTTVYHLSLTEMPGRIFTGTSVISPTLPLLRDGDRVSVEYLDSADPVIPLAKIAPARD